MVPRFFSLDNANNARRLQIHLRDMYRLYDVAPDLTVRFQQGKFAVGKTSKPFSTIPTDQAHEQNNALVKGEGRLWG